MRKPSVGMAPEGVPFILLSAFSSMIFAIISLWPAAVILLAVSWVSCHFFRDPERVTPKETGVAVSAADGKVIKIERIPDPFTGELRTCICVFMNLFNVHVNRMPVDAEITGITYFPGKFFNASLDKASLYQVMLLNTGSQ